MCAKKFLSTPSARRATIISSIIVLPLSISIHALREEGDRRRLEVARHEAISIHALREEGDKSVRVAPHRNGDFYPRPPRGGRPWAVCILPLWAYFYPRPPRGGRRKWQYTINSLLVFLSTPSARRATPTVPPLAIDDGQFLSTPSARRATIFKCVDIFQRFDFYPRPPRGGRPAQRWLSTRHCYFYPRPPRGGRRIS